MYGQPMPPEEHAALQRKLDEERQAKLGQRILGIRAAHRTMPVKEIAYRVGVSAGYVEQVLARAAGPS